MLVARIAVAALVVGGSATGQVPDVTSGPARAFYVSPDGDDTADGSAEHPWKTIQRALTVTGPDVTVNLGSGVYREPVVIQAPGGADGRPFTLQSAEGQRAVLDGRFEADTGVTVCAPHVVVRGLEIRNWRQNGIQVSGRESHHVLIERNAIHRISSSLAGEGEGARGIWVLGVSDCTIRQNTVYLVVGNSESFGVLFDLRSAYKNAIHNALVEKNLFYLIDKAGIRIVDNSHPDRCHVLADPAHIRGNIAVHIGYVGLEVNYVNTAITERGPLGDRPGAAVCVEDNFVGWCSSYGINPKQSADGISRHNTICGTEWFGYLQSGGDSYRMRIEGNLLADNVVGSMVHTIGEGNQFVGNYYRQPAAWPDFFWDRTNGWGTTYTDMADLRARSALTGVEAGGVLDNTSQVFRAPERGDFRLIPGCPAAGAAPDGEDFGAREAELTGVGASGRWGLGNIPPIPEIRGMRVLEVSSQDAKPCPINPDQHYSDRSAAVDATAAASGLAAHLVDGAVSTCWRPESGQMPAWAVIDLPGEDPAPLGAFAINVCHTGADEACHPRELRLSARIADGEPWREIAVYTRYRRGEGRIFPVEGAPRARQVKLDILSNHGHPEVVEVGEFRLYEASEATE